jgi:hypothetical protein
MSRTTELSINNLPSAVKELNASSCKKMIVIFGSCRAIFDGRIKSFLPTGDRLLFVKKDESLILHGTTNVKPLNWQKGGAGKINFLLEEGKLVVKTFRPKTKESLEIIYQDLYQLIIYDAHDTAELSVYGSEHDLSDYLFEHPEIIDDDFQPTAREFETPFGFLDLRGVDREGNIIIIEVKKRAASPADAYQLQRYQEYFAKIEQVHVRGILVAQKFSAKVMNILQAAGLEAVAIPWQEIFPTLSQEKPAITIDDFIDD